MANSIQVKGRQTLIDIAVQQCGAAESIFDVAGLNDLSITDDLVSGQQVLYGDIVMQDVADYFRKYGNYPASSTNGDTTILPLEGVDYWAIGYNFIIS